MNSLTLEKRKDGWWVVGGPSGVADMGPYTTKGEADEDRRGVERWIRANKRWLEKECGAQPAQLKRERTKL